MIVPDHHMLVGKFGFNIDFVKKNEERKEVFLFNDPEGIKTFKTLTSSNSLSNCFTSSNFEAASKKWFKELNNIIHRSFKKVRISGKSNKNKDIHKMLKEKDDILKKHDELRRDIEECNANEEMYKLFFDHEDKLEEVN